MGVQEKGDLRSRDLKRLRIGSPDPVGLEKTLEHWTFRRREKIWRERREHYRLLAENSMDVITVLSPGLLVEYASPSVKKILGYRAEEIMGTKLLEWVHPEDTEHVRISMNHRIQIPGPSPALEFRLKHKDGSWRILEAVANNLIYDSGVCGIILTSRDISDRKQMEQELRKAYNQMSSLTRDLEKVNTELRKSNEQLAEISRRDPLTGLFNRKAAIEIVGNLFRRWRENGTQFSVQIIDVDSFKFINDTYGHLTGDTALRVISSALLASTDPQDMASRFGGDEFLVALSGKGIQESMQVGRNILNLLNKNTIQVDGVPIRITVSIGVATVSLSDFNLDSLLNRADQALYRAKKLGKNQVASGNELPVPA